MWEYRDPVELLEEAYNQLHIKTSDGYIVGEKDPVYIGPRYKNELAPLPNTIGNYGVTVEWDMYYRGDGGGWPGSKKYQYVATLRISGASRVMTKSFDVIYVP